MTRCTIATPSLPDTRTGALLDRFARLPDGPERTALREQVIESFLPMAKRLSQRYRNRGESEEDLLQVASLGLIIAVDRYDPDRGSPFEPFAVPTIVGELKRHFRDHTWDLHVPRRVQEARNRVRSAEQELAQHLEGRRPTVKEIAAHLGISEQDARLGVEADAAYSALSLDAPLPGAGALVIADVLGAEDSLLGRVVDRITLRSLLAQLSERERLIIFLRFFREMPQHEIAATVGVSQMHISRLLTRSFENLRDGLLVQA